MLDPDRDRLVRALGLFSTWMPGQRHALATVFECLGNQLQLQAIAFEHREPKSAKSSRERQLARLFTYASFRLTELLLRLEQLNWMQREFCSRKGDEAAQWPNFAALAIKDFHIDLGSVMESVAPPILQVVKLFDAKGEHKFPGFADIQRGGSPRSIGFRRSIPQELLNIIDSTDRWWPPVKRMRDHLAHREHTKIVFGSADVGVFFQVYTSGFEPVVVHPALSWNEAQNVADFRMYSAAVLGELLVLLEDLGRGLTSHLGLSVDTLTPSMRVGDFRYLLDPLERLLAALGVAP